MKQVLQSYRTGELWLADVPEPACLRRGVKVKVQASLVSAGTERRMLDLARSSLVGKALKRPDQVRRVLQKIKAEGWLATWQQVNAKLNAPVPLGYSAAGVVVEHGVEATTVPLGATVACAGAGYASHAEYVSVPRNLCVAVDNSLPVEAGCFATVGAIAMQAVRQCNASVGENVGVIGLGLLGNLVAQILQATGVRVYGVERDTYRLQKAVDSGVERVTDRIADLGTANSGRGVDAVIIAAASRDSEIMQACPSVIRHKGRIVVLGFIGMDCPHAAFYEKELDLRMSMSYGPGRYDPDYEEQGHDYPFGYVRWTEQRNISSFLELVAQGSVNVSTLKTHEFPIDDALLAYQLLNSPEPQMGIVLRYPGGADDTSERPLQRRSEPASKITRADRSKEPGVVMVGAGSFMTGIVLPICRALAIPVRAVVSRGGVSGCNLAKELGADRTYTNLDEALSHADITHAVIATPHAIHAKQVQAAVQAGVHVLVEKPLCTEPEELLEIQQVYESLPSRPRLMVGFNRRWSPLTVKLREELNRCARPMQIMYRVNAGVLPPTHQFFTDYGGRITAEGCHFIDWCQTVVGTPAVRVTCVATSETRKGFDSFSVSLLFECGSQATILYSGLGDRSLEKEHVEVYCAGCIYVIDDWCRLLKHAGNKRTILVQGRQRKGWQEQLASFVHGSSLAPESAEFQSYIKSHELMFLAIADATRLPQ